MTYRTRYSPEAGGAVTTVAGVAGRRIPRSIAEPAGDRRASQATRPRARESAYSRLWSQPLFWVALAGAILFMHGILYSRAVTWDAVDDAYISFRYARNAAQGYGLVFNPGEAPVEGYTNFLWTVLMVPLYWFRINVPLASVVLGLLIGLACLWLLYRFTAKDATSSAWVGAVAALLLAADGSFAFWAVSGMETHLLALLLLLAALSYRREMHNPHRFPLSGLWLALAAMTRPEGLLVLALTGVHQLLTRLLHDRRVATRQDWLRLLLFLLVWFPWFLARWDFYGYPVPNTFYAKVTLETPAAQWARGLTHLQTYLRLHLGPLALAVAGLALLSRRWAWFASYLALVLAGYSLYIAFVGGDWSVGRFFAPLMPLYYLLVAAGLDTLAGWLRQRWSPPANARTLPLAGLLGLLVALGFAWTSSWHGEYALFVRQYDVGLAGRARTAVGQWLGKNTPADALLAVDAAGQIPYYANRSTIDMYGINDLYTAHLSEEKLAEWGRHMGTGLPGHEKMDWDYVLGRKPDYVIIYGNILDGVGSYERIELPWTEDTDLRRFLSVYRRRE